MKFSLYLAALVAVAASSCATAAQIGQDGADGIRNQIAKLLPPNLQSVFTISPDLDHYLAKIDIAPVTDLFQRPLHISEMTPIAASLTPRKDGLWDLNANGSMWLIGDSFAGIEPSHFQLTTDKYQASATIDPATGTTHGARIAFDNLQYSTRGYTTSSEHSARDYTMAIDINDAGNDLIDGKMTVSAHNIWQRQKSPQLHGKTLEFSAASASSTDILAGINKQGLTELVEVFAGSAIPGLQDLTTTQKQQIQTLMQQHWPVLASFSEVGTLQSPKLRYGRYSFSADSADARLEVRSGKQDGTMSVSLDVRNFALLPADFPPPIVAVTPDNARFDVHFKGLDIKSALIRMINSDKPEGSIGRQANWPKGNGLVDRILMSNDRMQLEITNVSAHSPYYDVAISGWLSVNLKRPKDHPEVDITITARDLDKTVTFLQSNASAVPQFGQASFMVLMAKGMAKKQPDGAMVWHIRIDEKGRRYVNDHQLGR